MPDDEEKSVRFTFARNTRGQTERLTKQPKGKKGTENYLIYARELKILPSTREKTKFSSLRRADEEKWFINKQKGKEEKENLCWWRAIE